MLTKKDYIAIAKILAAGKSDAEADNASDGTEYLLRAERALAEYFAGDNPRFNPEIFRAACQTEREGNELAEELGLDEAQGEAEQEQALADEEERLDDLDGAKPLGIPYGEAQIADGRLYTKCPECGKLIAEGHEPETGEPTSANYGAHYMAEHYEEPARVTEVIAELDANPEFEAAFEPGPGAAPEDTEPRYGIPQFDPGPGALDAEEGSK